jgi:hypothetical protein
MSYSLDLLKTKADCDAILAYAAKEKRFLEMRKTNKDFASDQTADVQAEIASKLASVNGKLAGMAAYVDGLPDGPDKRKELVERERLEYQKGDLLNRQMNYNVQAVLDSELDIARVDKEIEAINDFTGQVETKKTELPA